MHIKVIKFHFLLYNRSNTEAETADSPIVTATLTDALFSVAEYFDLS